MRSVDQNHSAQSEVNSNPFTRAVMEVLDWKDGDFDNESFRTSRSKGKDEIKETFSPEGGSDDKAEKIIDILSFLTSKMNVDDSLRLKLGSSEAEDSQSEGKEEPSKVLKKLLLGEYDGGLSSANVAEHGEIFTLALYFYKETSGDKKEILETMSQLIARYDEPNMGSLDEYGLYGFRLSPQLARLSKIILEKHNLISRAHEKVKKTLSKNRFTDWARNKVGDSNLNMVIGASDSIQPAM